MKRGDKKRKGKGAFIAAAVFMALCILFIPFSLYENNHLDITSINYLNDKIPAEFDGFKIVQLSDLHNKMFGKNQKRLTEKVKSLSPDIIVITGDIVSRKDEKVKNAEMLLREMKKIAPVYYVEGNHEKYSSAYISTLISYMYSSGINVLWNSSSEIKRGNASISLAGVRDLTVATSYGYSTSEREKVYINWVKKTVGNAKSDFKILLAHRPEYFDEYSQSGAQLVFSGHAHGGQFILPFIGGVYTPGQGFKPKYYRGTYEKNGCTMVVNRGLGTSGFFLRINNHPEIICVTLKSR